MTVYKRNRKETATQYVVTAQELQVAVIRYVMNEKYVPKKWRYILVRDVIHVVSEIVNNVVGAHRTFPNTEERLVTRRHYLEKSSVMCYQLQSQLLCMVRTIDSVNADNLGGITSLLLSEVELLSKTLKNSHLVAQQEV